MEWFLKRAFIIYTCVYSTFDHLHVIVECYLSGKGKVVFAGYVMITFYLPYKVYRLFIKVHEQNGFIVITYNRF